MRVFAQDVLQKAHYRRRVFDEKALHALAGKTQRQAFLEESAINFAVDILGEFDIPSIPNVSVGTLRGFEADDKAFNKGSGYIEVYAKFKTMSNFMVRMEFLMPVIRGELYRPSIIRINGKKAIFSSFIIDALLNETETIRPAFSGLYRDMPSLVHVVNVEHGLYEVPMGEFAEPVHDRYLFDQNRM